MHSEEIRIAFVKLFYENGSSSVRARRAFTVTFGMDLQQKVEVEFGMLN